MGRVKNFYHDEICEAAALRELGAEEFAWLRDSGRHAKRGDANAAPSEGCQSGGGEADASPKSNAHNLIAQPRKFQP